MNVTLVPPSHSGIGYLTIWPTGELQPIVSTMNSLDGRIKANAAIVPAGASGSVNVYLSNTANVVIDVNGYFTAPAADTLQFYPLTPCRVVDTRNADGNLGGPYLTGQAERDFPMSQSSCIPQGDNIQAYSFNFTVVPHPSGTELSYLTAWPAGQTRPVVSTLNNLTATVVANAAIVPAGTDGSIAVYPTNDTDLVIDVNGYFAAPGTGGLSLYSTAPCRVLDTRQGQGAFSGELTVDVVDSACSPPSTAKAYVFNATVVPAGSFGYLTLWPDGDTPTVGFYVGRNRRGNHVEYGDRSNQQRFHRRLMPRDLPNWSWTSRVTSLRNREVTCGGKNRLHSRDWLRRPFLAPPYYLLSPQM